LLKLLDPAWFAGLSKSDQTIVNEIVNNGTELRTLVREKSGAVEPAVLPYLARAVPIGADWDPTAALIFNA
jgi:hypothetical protein